MGCAGLIDREDTKPVTKYKSPREMKANDREKETWLYFLQGKGFQTGTTILVFLQHDVNVFLFGIQSPLRGQTCATPGKLFSPHYFNPCVICGLSWSGYRFTSRLTILPHTPPHPSDTPADFYAKLQFIITKDRI